MTLTTTTGYDDLGRIVRVTNPRGDTAQTVYDDNGQVSQEKIHYLQDDGSFVIRTLAVHEYDAADRRIKTTDKQEERNIPINGIYSCHDLVCLPDPQSA